MDSGAQLQDSKSFLPNCPKRILPTFLASQTSVIPDGHLGVRDRAACSIAGSLAGAFSGADWLAFEAQPPDNRIENVIATATNA